MNIRHLLIGMVLVASGGNVATAANQPNILMIAIDDLRPELACYGATQVRSPNIDALAAAGVRFARAYCSVAVCGASRGSLLSGCRPETTQCWSAHVLLRTQMPDVLTLPQHFKNSGYQTAFFGKVYHKASDDAESWTIDVDEVVPRDRRFGNSYARLESYKELVAASKHPQPKSGPATENGYDVPDHVYVDGQNADRAVALMNQLAGSDQPFFLAVGFRKPHLPFVAPGKYWDLYDRDSIAVPSREKMKGSVPWGRSTWGELRPYLDIDPDAEFLDDDTTRRLIHGYYAATSFTDAQVGKLIRGLKENGLSDNTIVFLWGDHGWYLGDYGEWCKHTNYEIATRVPFIWYVPSALRPEIKPGSSDRLVELLDIYPTLCELAGLETPSHLHGSSIVPLLKDHDRPWREAAISQYYKTEKAIEIVDGQEKSVSYRCLGTSVRTDRFRFTRWKRVEGGQVAAEELVDLERDPHSTVNVVDEPEYADILPRLRQLADQSATGVAPPSSRVRRSQNQKPSSRRRHRLLH